MGRHAELRAKSPTAQSPHRLPPRGNLHVVAPRPVAQHACQAELPTSTQRPDDAGSRRQAECRADLQPRAIRKRDGDRKWIWWRRIGRDRRRRWRIGCRNKRIHGACRIDHYWQKTKRVRRCQLASARLLAPRPENPTADLMSPRNLGNLGARFISLSVTAVCTPLFFSLTV